MSMTSQTPEREPMVRKIVMSQPRPAPSFDSANARP
jgi:hypothetical protein